MEQLKDENVVKEETLANKYQQIHSSDTKETEKEINNRMKQKRKNKW